MTDEQQAPRHRHGHGVTEGGDPVCWLDQVCDECGAMRENPSALACARCGAPFPGPGGTTPAAAPDEPPADADTDATDA